MELRYFRNVDKKEVDFVVMKEQQPVMFVECKSSKKDIHPALTYLSKCYPSVPCAQLSRSGDFDLTNSQGIRLCSADRFLKDLV